MRFYKDFAVYYFETNRFLQLRPVSILNYLEETATEQVEKEGFGFSYLNKLNCGWALIQWHIEFYEYPVWGEKVQVETWPSGFDKLYATREYFLKCSNGEILAKASSRWIFIDLEKRRPVRIPAEFIAHGWAEDEFNFPVQTEKPAEFLDPLYSLEFAVRRSDIDTNGHVNNAKYLEWIIEGVPEKIYRECRLVELDLHYKKEISFCEEGRTFIISQCDEESESEEEYIYKHQVVSQSEKISLAFARTKWVKQ